MRIAVIGSGGREHALLWRLLRDAEQHTLLALPGNCGTTSLAQSVPVDVSDVASLRKAVIETSPDLVVVGPEVPLAHGIVDLLAQDGVPCFGPVAAAARLESSKVFSKQFMHAHGIPTAEFEVFTELEEVRSFLRAAPRESQWVVKANGLAAGKGAFVCDTHEDAIRWSCELLKNELLGDAGKRIVLERRLEGREVSALYLCDGERFLLLPPAQDYKRAFDGDRGSNTGGMGSYCPAGHLTAEVTSVVERQVVEPTLKAMADQGSPYRGVLYVGLMLTSEGPQVIEFNCRFGDPETQVILPVLKGDFAATLLCCAEGRLNEARPLEREGAAVCVVLAADGYPDHYDKGIPLQRTQDDETHVTFHAGTTMNGTEVASSGGRVLNAVGLGETIPVARLRAYELAEQLLVQGLRMRTDIAEAV